MPRSNGQVGRYDIREGAVHTNHILDEAVVTEKIPDLAITFPDKIDDPQQAVSFQDYSGAIGLTTTFQNPVVATVDVPAWADTVTFYGTFLTRILAGSNQNIYQSVRVIDPNVPTGTGAIQFVTSGNYGTCYHPFSESVVGVAGSTLSIYGWAAVSTGTTTSDFHGIEVLAIFGR